MDSDGRNKIEFRSISKIASETHRVRLDEDGRLERQFLFGFDVVADVAEFLLELAHRLKVGRVVEGVAPQQEQLEPPPPQKKKSCEGVGIFNSSVSGSVNSVSFLTIHHIDVWLVKTRPANSLPIRI